MREANSNKQLGGAMRQALEALEGLIASSTVRLIVAEPESISVAAKLAIQIGHPLKDCLYLALAMDLGCELVTCDAKFAAKAKGVWAGVRVLGE